MIADLASYIHGTEDGRAAERATKLERATELWLEGFQSGLLAGYANRLTDERTERHQLAAARHRDEAG